MKKLLILMMGLLVASPAFALIDTDPDMMGLYFDETADLNCTTEVAPYAIIPGYFIMTNPSNDSIGGFEFGYDVEGSAMILSIVFPPSSLDVGGGGTNHIVGLGEPLETTEATILATISILYMDAAMGPVHFTLHGSTPSSIDPMLPTILYGQGELMSLGTSTTPGAYTAVINGVCEDVVDTEETTFDSLKSLYR